MSGIRRPPWANIAALFLLIAVTFPAWSAGQSRLVYLVSDQRIPYWDIMYRGIASRAEQLGYELVVMSAANDARTEIENLVSATRSGIDGVILSPTDSVAAVTLLQLAGRADVPVVIADIGAESGDYVSFIESDNEQGAYELGRIVADALGSPQRSVGIISIPQSRANGRARTRGFLRALEATGLPSAGLRQQIDFSHDETYRFAVELMQADADLGALWLQGSDRYQAALDAIAETRGEGSVLLACFDSEPEFIDMLRDGRLVAVAMQQPFKMGEMAVNAMHEHLLGKTVPTRYTVPVLAVSADNLDLYLPIIERNVLGRGESRERSQ